MVAQAAGTTLAVLDEVLRRPEGNDGAGHRGQAGAGIALVRPPGHHAVADEAMGFCFFNNVAIAARHAQSRHGLQKVSPELFACLLSKLPVLASFTSQYQASPCFFMSYRKLACYLPSVAQVSLECTALWECTWTKPRVRRFFSQVLPMLNYCYEDYVTVTYED